MGFINDMAVLVILAFIPVVFGLLPSEQHETPPTYIMIMICENVVHVCAGERWRHALVVVTESTSSTVPERSTSCACHLRYEIPACQTDTSQKS